MSKFNITVGADPEAFLFNTRTNRIVSSIGIVDGDKQNPYQISDTTFVQKDNIMLEFNIIPANTREGFINNINKAKREINAYIQDKDPNLKVLFTTPSAVADDDILQDEECRIFGCDPDINAYTREFNKTLDVEEVGNLRFAAGHVHIGHEFISFEDKIETVKTLDILLGYLNGINPLNKERNKYYGKLGNFRDKPYGLEYRTPSNIWLENDETIGNVFDMAVKSVTEVNKYIPIFLELERKSSIEYPTNPQNLNENIINELFGKFNLDVFKTYNQKPVLNATY